MKIKEGKKTPLISGRFREFYKRRKRFSAAILSLVGLMVILGMFFFILGYGAYLNKLNKTTYYKHTLLQIADLDFSFFKNFIKGEAVDFDEFKIDIKFKHLMRIQYLREQAVDQGTITEAMKNEEFPAKLTFNGQTYGVKINLTGLRMGHILDPSKWSFQVKVKGDDTILGMKRFSLLVPDSRGYLTDWVGFELMRERGLMGFQVDFVDVTINGKPAGIYYMEERYDKYLLESNHLREGIIFIVEDAFHIYREAKLMESPDTRSMVLLLRRMWQEVMAGDLPPGQFFDLEKFAKAFAVCDLMNIRHPLMRRNLRFYFNPVTGLAEPIIREWEDLKDNANEKRRLFLEASIPASQHYLVEQDPVIQLIYDNLEFKRKYIKELAVLCDKNLVDELFARHGKKLDELTEKVYRHWPFYEVPIKLLYDQQEYIKSVLYTGIPEMRAYFGKKEGDHLLINLRNQQNLPLQISYLSWRDTVLFYPAKPLILDSKTKVPKNKVEFFDFQIPVGITWSDTLIQELKVHYNFLGLPLGQKNLYVLPWTYKNRADFARNPIVLESNYTSFPFIKEQVDKGIIMIPEGKWTLDRDLIIPKNRRFVLEAGAEIDLIDHARIISYSPLLFQGTEEKPILLHSSDDTGQGLQVISANKRSQLSHTQFARLSRPKDSGWQLTGAVTFYESPVDFYFCSFSENLIGDDFLNVIRSEVSMDQVHFKNINADAFDCDFCKGSISNSSFIDVGNDGIDVSGTEMTVNHVFMNRIGDKGLSAGEDSEIRANRLNILNAEIGITSKDQSKIHLTNSKLQNNRIGVALFQKKSEFGPAFMIANELEILESEIPFLIEPKSSLLLDGKRITANKENVKEILYGIEYGKSSK